MMHRTFKRNIYAFAFMVFALFVGFPVSVNAATIYTNYSTGNDTTGDGSSGNPYKTFNKAYTSASALDTIRLSGTFSWANADETGDAATSGYTLGKELTIIGDSASSTIIQAAASANSAGKRVFTIAASASTTIQNVMIRYGSGTSGAGVYINAGATTTLSNVDLNNNITSNTVNGGAIYVANAEAYISNASIHDNGAGFYGGALYVDSTGKNVTVTNSTIYYNYSQWTSNAIDGGGIYINLGTTTVTNSTIVKNGNNSANTARQTTNGGGIVVANSASAKLILKNSIVAQNTAGTGPNIYKYTSGVITNNGYNIVGKSTNYTATTGDWVDSTDSGTFTLNTVGTTGTLGLAGNGAQNDSSSGVNSFYLSGTSVALNNADGTANNAVSIPALDSRGASRSGATDIGAFEINGAGLTASVPTTQSSSITFGSVEYNSMNVTITNGNGSRRVVFVKAASSGTASPVDGTAYAASSVFGSGDQIGASGWYAVYNDTATTTNFTITGLTRNTTYSVQSFEYNGVSSANSVYDTATASGNPSTQASHNPVTLYANYSTGNDTTGDGTLATPYKTFTKAYSVTKALDTIHLTGTFNWANADETGDAATSGFTIGKELTVVGDDATSTIVQAASTASSAGRRVFTIGTSASTTLKNMTIRYGYTSSGAGVSVSANATTTFDTVDVSYNLSSDTVGNGGGINTSADTIIRNSTIHDNAGGIFGGGLYIAAQNKNIEITNSSLYYNYSTWCCNALEGGAIYLNQGTTTITNSTLVKNGQKSDGTGRSVYYGAGIEVKSDTSARLYLKNTIIAQNIGDSSGVGPNVYKGASGTITNGGYNVIGKSSGYTATTGDWVDSTDSGTFTLNTVGTTGTLNLASAAGLNNNLLGVYTWGVSSASSVIIDHANGTANNGISIPTLDQRGAARTGATDIGAFEYGGSIADITAPTASTTAPVIGATVSGASVTLSADASDDVSLAGVKFYVDGGLIGAEDTSSPYAVTWDTTATTTGTKSLVAVARDSSNNYATSTAISFTVAASDTTVPTVSLTYPTTGLAVATTTTLAATASDNVAVSGVTFYVDNTQIGSEDTSSPYSLSWDTTATTTGSHSAFAVARDSSNNYATSSSVSFSVDNVAPIISSVSSGTPGSAGATITWTTDEAADTQINYGATNTYGATTTLSTTLTTSHSQAISGLSALTIYHYRVRSTDSVGNLTVSIDGTFTTASGDVTAPTVSLTNPSTGDTVGGTISLTATSSDNSGVAGVTFYVDNTKQGSEDSSSPYGVSWNTTSTTTGSHSAFAVARDTSSNYATSTSINFSVDNRVPVFTPTATTSVVAGATIAWSSNVKSSTKIAFGLSTTYASSTSEADTGSRVTSHSVSLTGLPDCAFYHYGTVGQNDAGDVATSSDATFATGGCTGGASISTSTIKAITASAGGSITHDKIALTIPASFTATSSSVSFQSNKLDGTTFFNAAGAPTGKNAIGTSVYNLKAFVDDTTTLSTFAEPLSVTFTYSASDVAGYDESTLKIYRYDSSWAPLSSCTVNTSAKTVTCTTTNFSDFAIFGDPSTTTAVTSSLSSGGGTGPVYQGAYPYAGYSAIVHNTTTTTQIMERKFPVSETPSLAQQAKTETNELKKTKGPLLDAKVNAMLFNRDLKMGLWGKDVRELQRALNHLHFFVSKKGPGSVGDETTYFGPATKAALARFQIMHTIVPTQGYFGVKTRKVMHSLLQEDFLW